LPPGLTLTSGGMLSGMPTSVAGSVYSFTVTANDGCNIIGSQAYTLTIAQGATVTSNVPNQAPSFGSNNQNITMTATVTSNGIGVNEGTVTFTVFNGSTQIGSPATSGTVTGGNATATYVLPGNTQPGTYQIFATYNPGPDFLGSSENTQTLTLQMVN